jgi:hypothetical protein
MKHYIFELAVLSLLITFEVVPDFREPLYEMRATRLHPMLRAINSLQLQHQYGCHPNFRSEIRVERYEY